MNAAWPYTSGRPHQHGTRDTAGPCLRDHRDAGFKPSIMEKLAAMAWSQPPSDPRLLDRVYLDHPDRRPA